MGDGVLEAVGDGKGEVLGGEPEEEAAERHCGAEEEEHLSAPTLVYGLPCN